MKAAVLSNAANSALGIVPDREQFWALRRYYGVATKVVFSELPSNPAVVPGAVVRVAIVEDDLATLERFAQAISSDARLAVVEKARTGRPESSPATL